MFQRSPTAQAGHPKPNTLEKGEGKQSIQERQNRALDTLSTPDNHISTEWEEVYVEGGNQTGDQVVNIHHNMPSSPPGRFESATSVSAEVHADNHDGYRKETDPEIKVEPLMTQAERSEPHQSTRLPAESLANDMETRPIMPVLCTLQDTIQRIMEQILRMNDARAPLAMGVTGLIDSLDTFLRSLATFIDKAHLSDDLSSQFNQLTNDGFRKIRDEQLATFQIANDQHEQQANSLIQDICRSSGQLDRLLEAHKAGLTGEDLTRMLGSSQVRDDLFQEEAQDSPELVQFLLKIGDIDVIREKLVDLNFEHEQILFDKESREKFGLSLDEDSLAFLESFDRHNQALLDELQTAEAALDNFRKYLSADELHRFSAQAPVQSSEEQDAVIDEHTDASHFEAQQDPNTVNPQPDYMQLQQNPLPIWGNFEPDRTTPMDPADFINCWLLNEVQSDPDRWNTYCSFLEKEWSREMDSQQLHHLMQSTWFNDISPAELAQRRRFADQQSMEQNEADSQQQPKRSATVVTDLPVSLPLLKLDAQTTANGIIEHALKAREIQHYGIEQQTMEHARVDSQPLLRSYLARTANRPVASTTFEPGPTSSTNQANEQAGRLREMKFYTVESLPMADMDVELQPQLRSHPTEPAKRPISSPVFELDSATSLHDDNEHSRRLGEVQYHSD